MNRLILAAEIDQNKKQIILRINAIASYFDIVVNPLAICNSMMKVLDNDDIEDALDSLDIIADYVKTYNIKNKYPFQYNRQLEKIKIILKNLGNEQKAEAIFDKLLEYATALDQKYFNGEPVSDDVIRAQESVAVINKHINILRVIFTQEELKVLSKCMNVNDLNEFISREVSDLASIKKNYSNNQQLDQYINEYKALFLSAAQQHNFRNNQQQRNAIINQINIFDLLNNKLKVLFTNEELLEIYKFVKTRDTANSIISQIQPIISIKEKYSNNQQLNKYIDKYKALFLSAIKQNNLNTNNDQYKAIINQINIFDILNDNTLFTQEELSEISKFVKTPNFARSIISRIKPLISIKEKYSNNQQVNKYIDEYKALLLSAIKKNDLNANNDQCEAIINRINVYDIINKYKNILKALFTQEELSEICRFFKTPDFVRSIVSQIQPLISIKEKYSNNQQVNKYIDEYKALLLSAIKQNDLNVNNDQCKAIINRINIFDIFNKYKNILNSLFTQEELKEISKFSNSQILALTIDKQISLLVSIKDKYPNNQQINQYINEYKTLFLSAIKQNDLANNTQQRNKIIDQIKAFDQGSKQKNLDNKFDNYKANIANKFNQIGQLVNVSLASITERLNATFEKEHINYSHVAGEDSSNISMALAKITNKYIPIVVQALKSDAVNRAIDNYSKMPNIRPYTLEMIFYTPRSLIDKFRLAYSAKSLLKTWLENFQLNNNYFFIFESIVRSLNRILNKEIELNELDESALQWLGLEKDKVMRNILAAGLNKVAQKAIFNKLNTLYESHNAYDIVLKQITTDDYKDLKDYKQLVIRYFTNIPDLRNKEYRYSPQKLVPILNQMVLKYKTKLRNVNLDTTEEELEERRKLEQNWLNEYSQYIPPTAIDYFQNKIYPIRNAKIVGKDGTLFDFDAFIEQCKKLYNANSGNKRKDAFEAFFRRIERNFSEAIKEWKEADTESRTHSKRIQYLNELGKQYSLTHEGAAFIEEHSKDPYLDYFNAINVWAVTYYDHSNEIKSLIQSTADQALAQILSYLNQTNEEFKRMNIPPVTRRLPDYIKGCGCTLLKPELVNSFDGIVNTQKQEYAAKNKPFDGFNVVKFFCNIVVGLSGDKVQVDNSWMRKNFGRETELLPKEIQEEYKRYRKRQNTEDAASISDFEPPKSQTPEELRTPKEKKNKDPWAGSFTGPKPEGGSEYFQKQKVRKNQNNGRGDIWVDQTSLKSLEQTMRIDQWKTENNKIGKKYNRLLRHIFG